MVVHTGLADHQTRLPMSWEEYNQLEDDIRGEFIDGALLTPPTPDRHHQVAVLSLVSRLSDVCAPSESVTTGWGWSPTGAFEEYIPGRDGACRNGRPGEVHRRTVAVRGGHLRQLDQRLDSQARQVRGGAVA